MKGKESLLRNGTGGVSTKTGFEDSGMQGFEGFNFPAFYLNP
jgi:hypothetical protein